MKTSVKIFMGILLALTITAFTSSCQKDNLEDAVLEQPIQGQQGTNGKDGADGERGPQGEQGPAGPQGEPGADGADGQDGNANVMASEWIEATDALFVGTAEMDIPLTGLDPELLENGVLLV